MSWHDHQWRPAGHVRRCADPDCLAWLPPPLNAGPEEEEEGPVQRPARTRKPGKQTAKPAAAGEFSNVVALRGR